MTAIDGLVAKAGEVNGASLAALSPALAELAAVQASVAAALAPCYDLLSILSGAEPFVYGFSLPMEPPEIKSDIAEPAREPARAEVNVDVRAIVQEVRKAVEGVGRDSRDIPSSITTYAFPEALAGARARAMEAPPAVHDKPPAGTPARAPARESAEAPAVRHEGRSSIKVEDWVEKSIRRSSVVMSDLNVVRQNIVNRSVTVEDVRRTGTEAAAIGTMGVVDTPVHSARTHVAAPEPPSPRPEINAGTASPLQKVTEAPPIRPRSHAAPPSEDAAFNVRRLAEALARSTESARPPVFPEALDEKPEPVRRAEWPAAPAQGGRPSRLTVDSGEANEKATAIAPHTMAMPSVSPVAGVARSFGAMDEYVKAVATIGLGAGMAGDHSYVSSIAVPGLEGGKALVDAVSGALPVAAPMTFPMEHVSPSAPGIEAVPPGSPVRASMGLASSMAALQTGRSPGMAMIGQLARSASAMGVTPATGVVHQAPAAYRDALSWAPPATPAAAVGALENIVNVMAPQAVPAMPGNGAAGGKVSNFHNTFNITVNVKGGEERDLRDLGKKIGQILSDEIRRYGGLS